MIVIFALMAIGQMAATEPPPSDQADAIVVRGIRKLDDWRAVLVFHGNNPECRVLKPTDDPAIDAIGCETMIQCFAVAKSQFAALPEGAPSARKRRAMRIAANREMDECFKKTRRAMMVDLTNRRSALPTQNPDNQ